MSGFKSSCKVRLNPAGDWQIMPPAGQVVQVGDGPAPESVFVVGPDDLNASGKLEVTGDLSVMGVTCTVALTALAGDVEIQSSAWGFRILGVNAEEIEFRRRTEEIEVTAGSSSAWGSTNLAEADSILLGVVTRVTQAPGGGATLVSVGRSLNLDEFLDDGPVALGSVSSSISDGDGVNVGPVFNETSRVFKATCNGVVTGANLRIRITNFYIKLWTPLT